MDAIRAAFESQFGTEWSAPVIANESESRQKDEEFTAFDEEQHNGEHDDGEENVSDSGEEEGPITVKHTDSGTATTQPMMSKSQRRRFMASGAPKDDTELPQAPKTKEEDEDLKNDLALQRLIEESHILTDGAKNQEFSGADISGAVDPMDHVGKTRLKVMEARLQKAGAKRNSQRMPQAMAVGIRDKRIERTKKFREESREAGIVLANDRHTRSKNRTRDKGLKINTIGKASEHGIHISPAEIARVTGKNKVSKGKRRR